MSSELPIFPPPAAPLFGDPVEQVIHYHQRTKHHYNRYARSLGFLDWANQPDPFRRFAEAPFVPLPLVVEEPRSPAYEALYQPGAVAVQSVTVRALALLLELSLGLSAWKRAGESEWALRNNPSSGNLHPTEGYLVLPPLDGLDLTPGLYHYAPKEHGLEGRAAFSSELLARLLAPFPQEAFLFGLTSVLWREAWKYGERAFRYCNHDIGHAVGAVRIAAATLGWRVLLVDGHDQNTGARLLGTHRSEDFGEAEPEHPDCLMVVWPERRPECEEIPLSLDEALVKELAVGPWQGKANRLTREHAVHWEAIDRVADASWKTVTEAGSLPLVQRETLSQDAGESHQRVLGGPSAGRIIRQRRSAVSFDGHTSITAAAFFRILQRVMPQADRSPLARPVPWDVLPWQPAVHLMLFVHRVEGLMSGLYVLIRDPAKLSVMQQAMSADLEWTSAPGCPADLPLYWLLQGDARRAAAQVSCQQAIAGDSAFSLGMVTEFEGRLRQGGAWWYPRLFWEAGLVGQVLYLEAEAAGVRGTGIGCFFDDPVHEIVGIKDLTVQSLYHFTIGGPVEDARLQTLPPYHHLARREAT
ncbi:MAG: hypothetical protein NBKEAIPA_01685 [Nitrospirae bacterium]|nr:hypothetical protein [Nitrospirota bacterium]MCK6492473.1 SagB/ThcOx family dehydrogenase [Nitrospira sp.]MEB2339624.1 SagB/ThcOx family dehydrogenase [Nitrospirales bacterium]